MAVLGFPLSGVITSWGSGSDFVAKLASYNAFDTFTLNLSGTTFDATPFATSYRATGKGLNTLTVSMDGFPKHPSGSIPFMGQYGLITYASGYVANAFAWDLDIEREVAPVTGFLTSPSRWTTSAVGRVSWSGKYQCYRDDTTTPAGTNLTAESASASLTVVSGAGGRVFSGSIISNSVGIPVKVGSVVVDSYSFSGTGALVNTGTATVCCYPADADGSALAARETNKTLTLELVGSGSMPIAGTAQWTKISIKNKVDEPVRITVDTVFSGSVTGFSGMT